ncbi:DUF7261 family protein [Haloplanus aerogenes]|uniref:Uncharacterized protein n=1 Tax=Haloplanus aerogenes TaxID=660522 RepID=A0A3M0DQ59_9EURY|nr:hypothetical protein [Haloplanus aerogenes]AZH24531.1 hypothetical protein DU502_03650 [Haloplanus aerogenes]RMB23817.1 hypothetical protein ATH50_1047 [Haloplanus aerogenes]
MTRHRGQLVLLAAAVVVTALVPMLLAYAQLTAGIGAGGDVAATAPERGTLDDTTRALERAVGDATVALSNGTSADRHASVAGRAIARLDPTVAALESSGTNRGVVVSITRNATAARQWAGTACPRGPDRAFDGCVVTEGVVTQTRANTTVLVAVAVDISVRGADGTATATVVVCGVRGAVAARTASGDSLPA